MAELPHIDSEMALDVLERRSSEPERANIRRHLSECRSCREFSAEWASFLDILCPPGLEDPPLETVRRAADIFDGPRTRGQAVLDLVASLASDTWFAGPALAGVRGESEVRHISLSVSEFDIHARIRYEDEHSNIWGQLLSWKGEAPESGFDVVLIDGEGRELRATRANSFGEFSFDEVEVAGRTVVLKLPDRRHIRWSIPKEGEQS